MEWKIQEKSKLWKNGNVTKNDFYLEIFEHSINVGNIALKIGDRMELLAIEKQKLYQAALFHDIGKSKIPQSILNKKNRLSSKEWEIMQKHTTYSQELFLDMTCQNTKNIDIAKTIRHHHENWDGTGYPDKIIGKDIPLYSRIIRIADIFDAITQPRVYRSFKIKNAMELMLNMKGKEIDSYIFDLSYDLLNRLLDEAFEKNIMNWKDQDMIKL